MGVSDNKVHFLFIFYYLFILLMLLLRIIIVNCHQVLRSSFCRVLFFFLSPAYYRLCCRKNPAHFSWLKKGKKNHKKHHNHVTL